jgi:hypothetical protein
VARDFDLHPKEKAEGGQRAPMRAAIPIDSGRRGVNDGRPTDSDKAASRVSWQGFWAGSLAGAGPVLLLGIALLCTLYPGLHKKNSTAANLKPEEQLRSDPTSQPSSTVQPIAKPSPIPQAVTARPEGSIIPEHSSNAAPSLPGFPGAHHRSIRYEATHKKAFGGCTGQLELTNAALHFRCPHQDDLDIPVSSIAGTHKDGVVLESGEKYHFLIANYTKDQVEMIFNMWLNRVRPFHQASGKSSF